MFDGQNLDDIGLTPGGGATLLPPGQHAVKIASVEIITSKDYNDPNLNVQRLEWVFESIQWKDAGGEPGIISLRTGFSYGNSKANVTHLLDAIFGRPLTNEERDRIALRRLVGLKGYALVNSHTTDAGKKTVKFAGWVHPQNRPLPQPSEFFKSGAAGVAPAPAPPASVPSQENTEFEDPFDK